MPQDRGNPRGQGGGDERFAQSVSGRRDDGGRRREERGNGGDESLGRVEDEDDRAPGRTENAKRVRGADVLAPRCLKIGAQGTSDPEARRDRAEQESDDDRNRVDVDRVTLPARYAASATSSPIELDWHPLEAEALAQTVLQVTYIIFFDIARIVHE